jgi:hypothetical protein
LYANKIGFLEQYFRKFNTISSWFDSVQLHVAEFMEKSKEADGEAKL